MTPKMKMTSKIKTTPKNKDDPKIEGDLHFSVAKVWKRNFPPYSSFGIGYTKTGIRYVSCCYEVIPKPFQGKHVCCNNSCSNQSIEKNSFRFFLHISSLNFGESFSHKIKNLDPKPFHP